jgi:positive regulator of sigma E activity
MSADDKSAMILIFIMVAGVILTVEILKAYNRKHDERTNRNIQSISETLQDQTRDR